MGSKYRLLPHLERTFAEIGGSTAVDAFSGSGVVSYLLKAQGFEVVSNDFLNFPHIITRASVANSSVRLEPDLWQVRREADTTSDRAPPRRFAAPWRETRLPRSSDRRPRRGRRGTRESARR